MDIQGSYIQLPIDIQAQYVTLEIDIIAQSVGNITMDIAAQTIGNLVIDIKAQSVGIYSQPEWTAKEGTDKDLSAIYSAAASGNFFIVLQYAVPSWKTLLICHFGGYTHGTVGNVVSNLRDSTAGVFKAYTGGVQGFSMVFNKPIVIPGGHTVQLFMCQLTGSDNDLYGHFGGFEI
ncbi:hypothetical protein ES703_123577 [subsurface metagenome]